MSPVVRRWTLFALIGAGYLALAYLGRITRLEGTSVSLIWPAGGYATTWLANQRTRTGRIAVLAWIAASLPVVLGTTGGTGAFFISLGTAANLVQTVLFVVILRGWEARHPSPRGVNGGYSFSLVFHAIVAAAVATAVGALIGMIALVLGPDTGDPTLSYLEWWGRNFAGVVVVGSLIHLTYDQLRRGGRPFTLLWERRGELLGVGVVSLAYYALLLWQPQASITFLAIPISVWLGWRFPIWVAALHTALWGSVATIATVGGSGPFSGLDNPTVEALVLQLYLLATLLTSLILGSLQAERGQLIADLVAAESRAAERAELVDAMTEAMSEGVVVVNQRREVVQVNRSARTMMGPSRADVDTGTRTSPSDFTLVRPDGSPLPAEEHPAYRARVESQVPPFDVGLVMEDGSRRILSLSASALTSGGAALGTSTGVIVVFRDVTEQREQQSELFRFAGTVAHDLRSPLTSVRGWLELAELEIEALEEARPDGVADVRLGRSREALARARASAVHMSGLIDDLLAQATAEGSEMTVTPLRLSGDDGLVADIVGLLDLDADIVADSVPDVLADDDMVRQLLANLLGNAVKYAEPGRRPHVRVSGLRRGTRIVVAVTDNGVGIPSGQHEQVFERFHRAHAGDARFSGTGLGLSICRTIVERHGGTLTAAPGPGGLGTTFRFDLTAAPVQQRAAGRVTAAETA